MSTYEKIVALIAELEADEKKTCNNDECVDALFDNNLLPFTPELHPDVCLILCDSDEYVNALIDAQRALEKLKAYYC